MAPSSGIIRGVSTGADNDLDRSTDMAKRMVTDYAARSGQTGLLAAGRPTLAYNMVECALGPEC